MSFAIRTVKHGMVRINGKVYAPDEKYKKYDGRLDGKRFAFGLYSPPFKAVSFWGTEEAFRDSGSNQDGPHVVDGTYPWLFWEPVESEAGEQ